MIEYKVPGSGFCCGVFGAAVFFGFVRLFLFFFFFSPVLLQPSGILVFDEVL